MPSEPSDASAAEISTTTLLSLPPQGQFESFQALYASATEHARLASYQFVIGKGGKKTGSGGREVKFLTCVHAGQLDKRSIERETRRRQRSTQKTGCAVKIRAKEEKDGQWSLFHIPNHTEHNHEAFERQAYYKNRQFSSEQSQTVKQSLAVGIAPAQISALLRHADPDCLIVSRDLYNESAKLQREARNGLSANRALIQQMESEVAKGTWQFKYVLSETTRRLEKLFWASSKSVEYLNTLPNGRTGTLQVARYKGKCRTSGGNHLLL